MLRLRKAARKCTDKKLRVHEATRRKGREATLLDQARARVVSKFANLSCIAVWMLCWLHVKWYARLLLLVLAKEQGADAWPAASEEASHRRLGVAVGSLVSVDIVGHGHERRRRWQP